MRNEDRLQQYFDGELSGEESDAVRHELEASEDLRAKLRGLEHLRSMVRVHSNAQDLDLAKALAKDAEKDALWAAIQGKIETNVADDEPMFPEPVRPEAKRPALQVIAGGKPSEKQGAKPAEQTRRSRSRVWLGIAGTITAAAAAVLLFVVTQTPPTIEGPPPGSEIEEVDFGYSTGAIFSVEGQEGARYAVVWISDEKPVVDAVEGNQ